MLHVVMPVYNEERCLESIAKEWIPELRKAVGEFRFLCIDDGSRDHSLAKLQQLAQHYPELRVVHKENTGHGQSCIFGYRYALENGADWVFQIDSDGQCDPKFFAAVWNLRRQAPAIFGKRVSRDDGNFRLFASRIVSIVVYLASRVLVKDSNVPYRLMRADVVSAVVNRIPRDIHLANILVSVLVQREFGITWVPINFRNRLFGVSSAPFRTFASRGWQLYHQLREALADERTHPALVQPALQSPQA